eukprot:13744700-Alexandrium_andersonii.AAC.1
MSVELRASPSRIRISVELPIILLRVLARTTPEPFGSTATSRVELAREMLSGRLFPLPRVSRAGRQCSPAQAFT